MNNEQWVPFYKEFAEKLLTYKNKRVELLEHVKNIYIKSGVHQPKLDKDNELVDIDPFTIFGFFNKNITKDNRSKIMNAIKGIFDLKSEVPDDYLAPSLNNQNATFYKFKGDRGEDDIENLWNLFVCADKFKKEQTLDNKAEFSKFFNLVINQKGNARGKVTMGLYWTDPYFYLNLDNRNEWYIYDSGKVSQEIVQKLPAKKDRITAAEYFEMIEKITQYVQSDESPFNDFIDLSDEAFRYSNEINEKLKAERLKEIEKIVKYWVYSPGEDACIWDECKNESIMAVDWDVGDLKEFQSKKELKEALKGKYNPDESYKNAGHCLWQFANDVQVGDVIFAKRGLHKIIGRGVVKSDYIFDADRQGYKNIRKVEWTLPDQELDNPKTANQKVLTEITDDHDYCESLNHLFDTIAEDIDDSEDMDYEEYGKDKFLEDVYMSSEDYDSLNTLLENKKNIILQGPPGVGKTYAAKRLAYAMLGEKNPKKVKVVQFHQNYSYEDFVMGFRPKDNGFELKNGVFYKFCKEAEEHLGDDDKYFFIIDEINRGNISSIFGELFSLIENTRRGVEVQLLYANETFKVPENVYIVGMMNTADRSLALIDYALRRRFAFFTMKPAFENEKFKSMISETTSCEEKTNNLISTLKKLNEAISTDDSLGSGFCIGHSYFCGYGLINEKVLNDIIEYELIPLLEEYWYDDKTKLNEWSNKLRDSIK